MKIMENLENFLKEIAFKEGISLFGIAKTAQIGEIHPEILPVSKKLPFAISIGMRLSEAVLETLVDSPNKIYFHHYKQVNYLIDRIALRLSGIIENNDYLALPIASSQTVDWDRQRGHLSHKEVAFKAGIGFYGRNNLIVHPDFGAKIRFATILTNIPLSVSQNPLNLDCGDCFACVKICPAGAIGNTRSEFNLMLCYEKLQEFSKNKKIGQYICGLCVKVCNGIKR